MSKQVKIPEIRIGYSRLLDPFFFKFFELKKKHGMIPEREFFNPTNVTLENIDQFKQVWAINENVLIYVQEVLKLDFYQSCIDVFVVGNMKPLAISSPLIISGQVEPERFVDILIHELLHRLVSDNMQKIKTAVILKQLFPNETIVCRNHVVIHAVIQKVYTIYLNQPDRLRLIQEFDKQSQDYSRAWDIVAQVGEEKIISGFTDLY